MSAQWADVAVLVFVSLAFAGLTSFKTATDVFGTARTFVTPYLRRRYFTRAALHVALAIVLLVAAVVAFRFTGVAS